MCLVSLVFDSRLNTLTFVFLMLSGTHILAYGSLIVLQLPLHLFILIQWSPAIANSQGTGQKVRDREFRDSGTPPGRSSR